MRLLRSKKFAPLWAFLVGALVFGGAATTAYAAALSNNTLWRQDGSRCFRHQAATENSNTIPKSGYGILTVTTDTVLNACTQTGSASIGNAAFLKKTNGSACSTSSATYTTGSSKTRYAYYNASSCGSGVQLQGSTTSYAYNGSGYSSASISAPFLTF